MRIWHRRSKQPARRPGKVYFSPAICKALKDDPGYMSELFEAAAAYMTREGGRTTAKLLDSNTDAIQQGRGLFWYHLTSSHGRIVIAGEAASGDIKTMTAGEFNRIDTLTFAELSELS